MNKFQIFLLLLSTPSCTLQLGGQSTSLLSSRVTVIPAPFGRGDQVRPSQPIIFTSKGSKICRPRPSDPEEIIKMLEPPPGSDDNTAALTEEAFPRIFGVTKKELESIRDLTTSENLLERLQPVRTDVGGDGTGWLKLGLFIVNGNIGSQGSYTLVVTDIVYSATARYRNQVFSHTGDIQAGYCGETASRSALSEGSETASIDIAVPFLYMVPAGKKVEYNSTTNNPFHNLTLYLDGFPIIDRTKKLDPAQQRLLDTYSSSNSGSDSNSGSSSTASTPSSNEDDLYRPGDPLIVIPKYTVYLTLRGHFLTSEGHTIGIFTKRVSFSTQSGAEL
ncbi:MAG: hypothetical protein ACR2M7_00595 [Bdellovibrionales bacterium]